MANYYILFYETIADYVEKRKLFRDEHLSLVKQYYNEGKLLMAGAFDPADGAALIFKVAEQNEVEEFVANDPYVVNNLITKWYVKKWSVVVGG